METSVDNEGPRDAHRSGPERQPMSTDTVTETVPIAQAPLSPHDHFQRAAEHLYGYLRPAGAPLWHELTRREQKRLTSALLIGAASLRADSFRRAQ